MITKKIFNNLNTYFSNHKIFLYFIFYYKIKEIHSLLKIKFYQILKYVFFIT
jgi:hypothetical protein